MVVWFVGLTRHIVAGSTVLSARQNRTPQRSEAPLDGAGAARTRINPTPTKGHFYGGLVCRFSPPHSGQFEASRRATSGARGAAQRGLCPR